jgi:hypothetical protein
MAGASLGGGLNWIAVPYDALRAVVTAAPQSAAGSRMLQVEGVS